MYLRAYACLHIFLDVTRQHLFAFLGPGLCGTVSSAVLGFWVWVLQFRVVRFRAFRVFRVIRVSGLGIQCTSGRWIFQIIAEIPQK